MSVPDRLKLMEYDLDRIDNRIAKLYAAASVAATGLVTSTILLLLERVTT